MAILGAQAVVSLVFVSFLQKICPIYSLGRWLITSQSLVRYLYPTDGELRTLAGLNKPANGKKNKKSYEQTKKDDGTFSVPRSLELTLSAAPVENVDVVLLHFYNEFIWLMDVSISTTFVVTLTYLHEQYVSPGANEFGISSIWCVLMVYFSTKPLFDIVTSFRLSENSSEIVLCCLFGFFFLISAMILLIVDDQTLSFHIVSAHKQFTASAADFLEKRDVHSFGPISLLTYRTILAVVSAIIGALLTFPGLRLARCHLDSLNMVKERPLMQAIMHLDLLAPLLLMAFWVPPLSHNTIIGKPIPGTEFIVTEIHFEAARDAFLVIFILSRLYTLRYRLQAYLNTACLKVDSMRKDAGKITNIELRTSITQVFLYLCVVVVQLVAPLMIIAGVFLMAKSFTTSSSVKETITPQSDQISDTDLSNLMQSVKSQVQDFTVSLAELRSIFSSNLLQSVTSYFLWFVLYAWTATTYFGLFYYSYLLRG